MKFRYDINALRALAVLLVVFYHFNLPYFEGGYAGVDIFFVISGYLMSRIILEKINTQSLNIIDFYNKRAFRIIPALLVMVTTIVLLGNFFFFPEMERKISEFAASSVLLLSNIYYYFNSGYFDLASKSNPFLHTWSLSVEWQFYMLYPILLWGITKIIPPAKKGFQLTIGLLAFFSLSYTIYLGTTDASQAFYSIGTRAWEMLLGCLIVLNEKRFANYINVVIRNVIAVLSFLTLLFFSAYYNDQLLWPSYYTLIPVFATTILLLCQTNFKFYENKIVQYFGKISYSLYLWHWPVYVFFLTWGFSHLKHTPFMLLISIILADLSYRFIESQLKLTLKQIIAISVVALGIALVSIKFPLNDYFLSDNIKILSNYRENYEKQLEKQFRTGECFLFSKSEYVNFNHQTCLNFKENRRNILLIGDSHAAQFSYSLNQLLTQHNANLLQATTSHCFPVPNTKGKPENTQLMHYIFNEFIPHHKGRIDLVIVSANWKDLQGYTPQELTKKWHEMMAYFKQHNLPYLVLGQTETYNYPFPEIIAKKEMYPIVNVQNFVESTSSTMNQRLKNVFPKSNYVDLYQLKTMQWITKDGKTPYMVDDNHFSTFGTEQVISKIKHRILYSER